MAKWEAPQELLDRIASGEEPTFAPVEVAHVCGYKTATVQELCRSGKIKAIKIGSQWRVPKSCLMEFIQKAQDRK